MINIYKAAIRGYTVINVGDLPKINKIVAL